MVTNKLYICRDWHIQPSEIDKLPYFEYELYKEDIHKHNKEEEKRQKEQEKANGNYKVPNANSMMRAAQQNMPKMPSMPSMPKF